MSDQTNAEAVASGTSPTADAQGPLNSVVLGALGDMSLTIEVRLGSATMTLRELTECGPGTVLSLNAEVGSLADLLVGGQLVARGELVAIDEQLGLRIVEIVSHGGRDEA